MECKDRDFGGNEALKDACKERVDAVTYYNITLEVRPEYDPGDVIVPPKASEVVYTYEGQVFDLGNTTLEDIYNLATDNGLSLDYEELEEVFGIDKLELIDFARQDDQKDANLEELIAERDAARE